MRDNLVSIITPVYNGSGTLPETVRSVLAQTYPDWELLIVDDGSSDDTAAVAGAFAAADPRIRVLHQTNQGCTAARNHGIREASGRYFCLLDSDDMWDPVFLESQIAYLKREKVSLVCSGYRYVDQRSREIKSPAVPPPVLTYSGELRCCHIGCLTGVYDSAAAGRIFLDEKLHGYCDDYAFWLEILKKTGPGRGNPAVLASYRCSNSRSITGNKFRLLVPHFMFHRRYCGLGFMRSAFYTALWAKQGLRRFVFCHRSGARR